MYSHRFYVCVNKMIKKPSVSLTRIDCKLKKKKNQILTTADLHYIY